MQYMKQKILKTTMEHTNLMLSTKFATPFFPTWSPMHALLLLVTVFPITCTLEKRSEKTTRQVFLTHFQKTLRAFRLLDHCYEKGLDYMEARILFCHSFPKEHINYYVHIANCDFDPKTLEDLKNFSKAIMMPTHPKTMATMTKATPFTPCDGDINTATAANPLSHSINTANDSSYH